MDLILTPAEVRVLGSLVEKQATTPENYPLSLSSLQSACNQKSSRDPIVSYGQDAVKRAVDGLREKNLIFVFYGSESRVAKYGHILDKVFNLERSELSALCILMLRGPQTPGEIRQRAAVMHNFLDVGEVEAALESLIEREDQTLAVRFPMLSGTRESRYAHLLSGSVADTEASPARQARSPVVRTPRTTERLSIERLSSLEQRTQTIRRQLTDLRQQFIDLKKQFE